MSVVEEDEDVIVKGGPLHSYLISSGFTDFEVFDRHQTNELTDFLAQKPSFLQKLCEDVQSKDRVQKFLPVLFEDSTNYDKFLITLLNSSIVRAEAEYWLRNLRSSFLVQKIEILGPDESLSIWQSPFTFLLHKPLLVFFLAQSGYFAYKKVLLQQRLITLQRMLANLEVFNRKLGMAVHLTQQGEMSQRFLSSTFNELAESFVSKSAPNGVFKLIDLLKRFSLFLRRGMDEMHQVNPLSAEFDSRQALISLQVPDCCSDEKTLCYKDLKEMQQYYKEILTIFTHQLAMNFIAQVKQEAGCQVEEIFPTLQNISVAAMHSVVELKQITDVLRGVNLLKAPPTFDAKKGIRKHSLYINPLIPAIESSGIHLRNALSFILNSSDVSDSELGNVLHTLQASRIELAAADSFLHKAEILVNRLNKTKEYSVKKEEDEEESAQLTAIPLDFSTNLSVVGDPFLEEVFQGTSFTNSLEWDDCGEKDDSYDSANSAYYQHLMNELQCVLVSKGKSRIRLTPPAEPKPPSMVTSTPAVPTRTQKEPSSNNNTTAEDTPTPKPRSKYAKIEQMTYVSPATLNEESPMATKSLANLIAQRAQQLQRVEETFEDDTFYQDAQD